MITPRDADHAVGVELQLEELVEQRERARVQGRVDDAEAIEPEIADLQSELADTIESAAQVDPVPPTMHPPDAPTSHAPDG
ncbi:MAG TPA: hypothetical protein VG184_11025 [Acidimicrobiales bacterium]|jgi:hypothetical protein|nr:hypothetical protein [Acidimicrobiales bacterium]